MTRGTDALVLSEAHHNGISNLFLAANAVQSTRSDEESALKKISKWTRNDTERKRFWQIRGPQR